jgi:MFS family permease
MADGRVPRGESASAEPLPDAAEPEAPTRPRTIAQRTFAALRHRNYRLWFQGQLVSMIGTWMQMSAQGFLVFELTRSTAYLGYVGFAAGLPSLLLMLYGGVIADRVARRNLLVITQSAMMGLAFALAALTFARLVQPWHIVLLALLLGTANAFDAPAAQAFVFELVDRQDVSNAIALNATLMNLATVVGPTVAGLTYAAFGAAWCFTLNGVSFLGVIAALLLMRLAPRAVAPRTRSALEQVKEGLRYTFTRPLLLSLLAAPGVGIVFVATYATLLPAWSVEVLGGDAATNGLLQSARGAGSLVAALMLAAFGYRARGGRWLTIGMVAYPTLVLVFAAVRSLPLAIAALVGVGWGGIVLYTSANTLIQNQVPDAFRGRVMSIYSMLMFVGMPLGALWSGTVAQFIGAPLTLVISAGVALLCALFFWLRVPELRRLN